MPDTIRTYSTLLTTLFQDGQAAGAITPQDVRDFIVTVQDDIGKRGGTVTRKSADQTVNNSATLVNDTHLLQALGTSEVWQFEILVAYTSDTNMDLKMALTIPASATLLAAVNGPQTGGSTVVANTMTTPVLTTSGETAAVGGMGLSTKTWARISGIVVTGASAGNLQLQWAQNAAVVGNTIVHANSYLIARKVA